MPGDTKYERRLWKLRMVLIGVAAIAAVVVYIMKHAGA